MTLPGILISVGILFAAVALVLYFYIKFGKTKLSNASLEATRIIEEARK